MDAPDKGQRVLWGGTGFGDKSHIHYELLGTVLWAQDEYGAIDTSVGPLLVFWRDCEPEPGREPEDSGTVRHVRVGDQGSGGDVSS